MARRDAEIRWYVAAIVAGCLLTLSFVAGGIYVGREDHRYRLTAQPIEAVVIGHHETRRGSGSTRRIDDWQDYATTLPDGRVVNFSVDITGHRPRLELGSRVAALYQPSDVDDVRIDDGQEQWIHVFLLCLSPLGALMAALGAYLWRRQRASARQST